MAGERQDRRRTVPSFGIALTGQALKSSPPKVLPRRQQLQLLKALAREAGWRQLSLQTLLSVVSSLLDIAGLGLAVSLLLSSGTDFATSPTWLRELPLSSSLVLLVGLILARGLIQARVAVSREWLRSGFTDRLRQHLLHEVFSASSRQLDQLGRGDLLALLMADITRSAMSLDQALRMVQALLAMLVYLISVLVVGRTAAWPLLLALAATASAALLKRSGSWGLGRIQSRLNAALQRTVGDGLHGLNALRAAAAEVWLLNRFARETAKGRWLLRERVRRRAGYNAWRDTLVVAIAGLWMLIQGEALTAEVLATTLVLAYRAGTSLSAVVQARRLCLGSLPGYEALRERRQQLRADPLLTFGTALSERSLQRLELEHWSRLHWQSTDPGGAAPTSISLQPNRLVAITGASGCGKTKLLDRISGLHDEEKSFWTIHGQNTTFQLNGLAAAQQLRGLMACAPQHAALFEASLRDNLLLGADLADQTIKEWLHRLGLEHLLDRQEGLDTPMSLAQTPFSGGEIHRLGLLRAWLRSRPVEVLDEPTAFLDASASQRVREVILERSRERLVLFSSHDPDLLKQADVVIELTSSELKV
ncbi:ABC transporter ATP-binding protein [Synechococcus sp. MIT S9504]|uniref:ATP-binding cassette domain-containing protein n=1 Tax=Synechococcus sp. MIT S9504 TaxID=1801628 RepID=UPI0007BC6A0D|nr:ABC transporter ATP-binding protein [Synechococcus sp. MIT S9504]KZR85747.1 Beta-(1-->2)glucan export ATP-binding/permease protein NdvA [Synechococcus sp. MIT S9504]